MSLSVNRMSDEELISGCRRRNARAQQQLYERFAPKMYAVCCRYLTNRADAEDVLVTAFTKIFERFGQYRGDGSLEGWIRRIVVNEALTFLRRNRSMFLETDLEEAGHKPDYRQLADRLEEEDLLRLISQLPAGYRMVFNLYAIEGYSHQEIAEQLGISENTSKSQLSRARVYLQRMLAEYEDVTNIKSARHESAT
ncbi:MAG: sigma-70 family RNA polymerase sigma factor [Cyclobacteriaceae bacterium]|nr:sigma-70 family RNA polymerase sigma factor [Cyclobacteriaceae bacterium]MDW8331450.1 sigma-70 family RNA polymerase sigma factor [Cyclobacteriaceae bacterium]